MKEFDFNTDLGISKEDVDNEKDVSILTKWNSTLADIESAIFSLHSVTSWKDLPQKAKLKSRRVFVFRKYIRARIASLLNEERKANGYQSERSRRKDRTLCAKFMEIAKRELPKEEYKRILLLAQEELSKNNY